MAAAFAHQAAGTAAGTCADRDRMRLFDQIADLIIRSRLRLGCNRRVHGHDAHRAHAGTHVCRQNARSSAGVLFKALADDGVCVALLAVGQNALHDAGNPDRVVVRCNAVVKAAAHDARVSQLVQSFQRVAHGLVRTSCNLLQRTALVERDVQADLCHCVGEDRLQNAVFRIVIRDAHVRQALETDLRRQFQNDWSVCHLFRPFPFSKLHPKFHRDAGRHTLPRVA